MRKIAMSLFFLMLCALVWGETVYEIQYTTDPGGASPLEGQIVSVTGIVTATNWYVSGNANRFFISDPEGGEWRGLFVFNYDYDVELGDEVELTAEVVEYYGFTELSNLESLTILSSGNPVPEPLEVSTGDLAQTEAYEGVLVRVNDVTVTEDPNNYGEAYIDDGSGECQTDDAMYSYEPVAGAQYSYMIGIVDYSYDEYGLNPRFASDIGFSGDPGMIEGLVSLDGGAGNVEDVLISAGSYSASPDDSGEYELELPPGTYNVTASLAGYSPQTINDVLVEENETTSGIDFVLLPQEEVTIYDIQYTEDVSGDSPYAGQTVTVTGIVSGFGFGGNNFFFITGEEGGAWSGLYVYQYDYEVAQGDNVTITGEVSEYYGFTELGDITDLIINSSGNALPAPAAVTTAELASSEAYESVLVQVNDVIVTALPNDYNEWFVDDGSGACQVDDGFGVIYPDLVLDDEFISITGVVDYSFNEYGLHPRSMSDFDTGETPELTPVYDIQFTEDPSGDSPYAGQTVTVEGIVTGSGYLGSHYFISSAEGGAWSGIYVYDDSNTPAEGDLVRFTAEVAEYFGFTELTDVSSFEVLSSGNTLPEPEMISTNDLATQEAYESVLVIIQNLTVTAEPNEYNEWFVDDGSGACQVDDCFGYIPESIETGSGIFYAITGLVDYSYAEFGLNPRYEGDFQLVPANDDNVIGIYNHKAFPNPFYADNTRSSVTIGYSLSKSEDIQVNIYNIRGQKVIELMQGTQPAGNYQLNWDGFGAAANQQPAGVYFYQISGENFSRTGKLLLIR